MKKVFIIGASGFLGNKLYDMYKNLPNYEVVGTYGVNTREDLVKLDITNLEETKELIYRYGPEIVINTAAYTYPDKCEKNKELAEMINHIGTRNIVKACKEVNARLDHISTVYVFDGKKGNYKEDDIPCPINWYGETKLRAEYEVSNSGLNFWSYYRLDKLYGYNNLEGSPNDIFSKIMRGEECKVNNDQIRQPVLIDDVSRALMLIQEKYLSGIFHLAGPDKLTRYELSLRLADLVYQDKLARRDLSLELVDLFDEKSLIIPVSEKDMLVERPKNVTLITEKIEKKGMVFTPLNEALIEIGKDIRGVER